jgi:hypothetical protein
MSADRPSIGQAAVRSWRDLAEVVRALSTLTRAALVIAIATALARQLLLLGHETDRTGPLLVSFLMAGAQAFLLTPYLIAVHRFIILGETTAQYRLAPGAMRFQLFFLWSVVLSLFYWAPAFLNAGLLIGISPWTGILFVLAAGIAGTIVSLRLVILFPAIAVDAPGATWSGAMADTKGYAWRILFISMLSALPVIAAVIVVAIAAAMMGAQRPEPDSVLGAVATAVFEGVLDVAAVTLAVAVASRLYEQLGDAVKRP